ncbi:MAG: hypothetical protein AAGA81_08095 [Acidobacteriota bacterium]
MADATFVSTRSNGLSRSCAPILPVADLLQYFERLFLARCRYPVHPSTREELSRFLAPRIEAFEQDEELWKELQAPTSHWLEHVADQASLLCEIRHDETIRPEFFNAARQIVSGWSPQPNTFLG